jgi:UDP-glucose 4-epimerase
MRGCDYVVHLAAALGVERTEAKRLECLFININGTINVLEACIKEKIKKVVFTSSSEVYGEQKIQPIEETSPLNPISNYAITKIVGEEYMRAYYETYRLKYNIVRLFNVYGEEQREEFVVPKFVKNVANEVSPIIYGNGQQIRSFCYVKDAARGIADALLASCEGEVFNIGNDEEPISLSKLAEKIIYLSGKCLKPQLTHYDNSDRRSERDIIKRIPSIEKAKRILGYKPAISLDEGLKIMLQFYKAKTKNGILNTYHKIGEAT